MSKKAKIVRYTIEIAILVVLIVVLRNQFMERSPTEYSGSWIKTPGPSEKSVMSLLWLNDPGILLAGSRTVGDSSGISYYNPKEIKWSSANLPAEKTQMFMDFHKAGKRIYATHFLTDGSAGRILYSDDSGRSWSVLETFPTDRDPRCITLAGSGRMYVGTVNNGVYLSSDNGETWTPASAGMTNQAVQCLLVDPREESRVYAGTLRGLFISSDGGQGWKEIPIAGKSPLIVDIEANPQTGDIFLISRDEQGLAHVARSTDSGDSWSVSGEGLAADAQPRCIAFHPEMEDSIFIGTVYDGIYRSDNNGTFWSPMNNEFPLETHYIIVHDLEFSTGAEPRLYAGTDLNGAVWEYRF